MPTNTRRQSSARNLSKVKRSSFFAVHVSQARLSLREFWQRPLGNVLTLAVIAMALAMPASLYLLGKNLSAASTKVTSPSQVSAFLKERTPEARVMILKDQIEGMPEVEKVAYISPQQGLEDLSQYSGFDQALTLLDDYALPGVLVMTPKNNDREALDRLVAKVKSEQDISDIRLDEDWLTRLDAIKNLVNGIVLTLALLMLGSVFLIVGNTLRFNVLANKEEIQTMKLIGATDSFILRPYLYSGVWFGFLGASIAWVLTAIITVLLNSSVEQLAQLYDSPFRLVGLSWDESLLLIMVGTFLGCLAAKISAQRHMKDIEPI